MILYHPMPLVNNQGWSVPDHIGNLDQLDQFYLLDQLTKLTSFIKLTGLA